MNEEKKASGGKRTALIVLVTVVTVILVAIIGVSVWINQTMNLINRDTGMDVTLSDEEIESILYETDPVEETDEPVETVEVSEEDMNIEDAEVLEEEDSIINILLIGQDRRPDQERQRSDTMILCTLNMKNKSVVLTSFLRDTYVKIPAWDGKKYGNNRLNVCYAIGGMEMLDQCLLDNFGVVVDYNVEVDFTSFVYVVDLMGGIDVELTAAEANTINKGYDLGGALHEGTNHLNGELALFYARIRKLDSDFVRTDRQRKVILALMENAKNMSVFEARGIINEVFPFITTDMTNGEIISLALKALSVLPELQVTSQRIPAEGTYYFGQVPGMSVIAIDMEANRQILKDTLTESYG